ncbi:MAG TPA: MotE family protein [Xanthobacteraceae bacterium]|jgi:flagellar motility protein MotE (MotC chaperone)|uniref:MotE family protein n=1 Tax=Roseixanthobacter finlandensis TaxID=3119922 RepID=UPI0026BB36B2|nr:MotE family protein [Xanthobacteraceae bacterium]
MTATMSALLPPLVIFMTGLVTGAACISLLVQAQMKRLREDKRYLVELLDGAILMRRDAAQKTGPMRARALPLLLVLCAALVGLGREAQAQSAPAARPMEVAAADASREDNAIQYCRSIVNAASDARFARQKEALATMEKDIEARIAALEAKRAEYQDWLQRREVFLKKADDSLISVISQMRPDAASAQISAMGEEAAAAVLAKLTPRVASAILNEMDPPRAARLTSIMVGLGRRTVDGRAS